VNIGLRRAGTEEHPQVLEAGDPEPSDAEGPVVGGVGKESPLLKALKIRGAGGTNTHSKEEVDHVTEHLGARRIAIPEGVAHEDCRGREGVNEFPELPDSAEGRILAL
jgi:hypothetical protein